MIKLYAMPNCPRCNVLKNKLIEKGIEFEESNDVDKLIDAGFFQAPGLEINGRLLNFTDANSWIGEQV